MATHQPNESLVGCDGFLMVEFARAGECETDFLMTEFDRKNK